MCVSSCFQKLDSFAGKFRDLYHVMVGLPNKVVVGNGLRAVTTRTLMRQQRAEKVASDDIWALNEYFLIYLVFFLDTD